jgi:hypothetical protein
VPLSRFDPNLRLLGEAMWKEILHAIDEIFETLEEFLRSGVWFNTSTQVILVDDLLNILANLPQAILLTFAEFTVLSPLGFKDRVIRLDVAFQLCVEEIRDSVQALDPQKNPRATRTVLLAGQYQALKKRIADRFHKLSFNRIQKLVFAAIKILESPIKLFTFLFQLLRFVVNFTVAAVGVAVLLAFFAGFDPEKWRKAALSQGNKRKRITQKRLARIRN